MTVHESLKGLWPLLVARFRQARLAQVAGSLTFTTLLALVPLFTVALALFSAFPVFSVFQDGLEKFFLQSLIPDSIAKPVMKTVSQFAGKAARLGVAGLMGVVVTALVLMLTIDRALNRIWRVRRPRPIGTRLMIYLAAMTLAPLVLGISFTAASQAYTASRGWGPMLPGVLSGLLETLETLALLLGIMLIYRYLPNTAVRWRDAAIGSAFVTLAFGMAKAGLGWYVKSLTVYAAVYGAFATLPILLLWIYIVWVIILSGAVLAATLPGFGGVHPLDDRIPGARFTLALRVLQQLTLRRDEAEPALPLLTLAAQAGGDPLEVRTVADEMVAWGWLTRIDDEARSEPGYLMRVHPRHCPLDPAIRLWLLAAQPGNSVLLQHWGAQGLTLADVLEFKPPVRP